MAQYFGQLENFILCIVFSWYGQTILWDRQFLTCPLMMGLKLFPTVKNVSSDKINLRNYFYVMSEAIKISLVFFPLSSGEKELVPFSFIFWIGCRHPKAAELILTLIQMPIRHSHHRHFQMNFKTLILGAAHVGTAR